MQGDVNARLHSAQTQNEGVRQLSQAQSRLAALNAQKPEEQQKQKVLLAARKAQDVRQKEENLLREEKRLRDLQERLKEQQVQAALAKKRLEEVEPVYQQSLQNQQRMEELHFKQQRLAQVLLLIR